jgi:glycosyltransferase involved in cell wall biosynthesis
MKNDLISIGIPVFNGEKYLEEALRSNLNQTYDNLELIISDNASTDRTESICRDYQALDRRIQYVKNEANIGAAQNYNQLFALSTGSFFRWSNADDVVHPMLVEKLSAALSERDDVAIAFGRTQLIDADGNAIEEYEGDEEIADDRPSSRYQRFYFQNGLTNIIYGLMRSAAMKNTELMGSGKLPAGDINFLAAMSLEGKFVGVPEVLFYRRIHAAAFSSNSDPAAEAAFWTASSDGIKLQNWRAIWADGKKIVRSKLSLHERLRTLRFWAQRAFWQRRLLLEDLRNFAMQSRDS